ncbi:uncharacterized protein JCM15063_001872 [Sporobolomyces koalae]|uniref:uncharacterized protein n=1 Tax=Sporobolomyces koalae TaxID=500713 RepID=UPI003171F5DC
MSSENGDYDPFEVFSSSLHSLFDHVVPANGDPLQMFTYNPPAESRQLALKCRIPPQQVNALFAHHVWNASLILADRIATSKITGLEMSLDEKNDRERIPVEIMSVCELGAGAGIPALLSARSPHVAKVVLTDYDDKLLVDNLADNIDIAHKQDPHVRDKMVALGHTWGDQESLAKILKANNDNRFTHLLLADTLWITTVHEQLLWSLSQLLARTNTARIHLVAGFHSGRNAVRSFLRKAKEVGLEPKGDPWQELAVGGQTRPWGWDTESKGVEGIHEDEWIDEKESSSERGKWVVIGEMGWSQEQLARIP